MTQLFSAIPVSLPMLNLCLTPPLHNPYPSFSHPLPLSPLSLPYQSLTPPLSFHFLPPPLPSLTTSLILSLPLLCPSFITSLPLAVRTIPVGLKIECPYPFVEVRLVPHLRAAPAGTRRPSFSVDVIPCRRRSRGGKRTR